MSKNKTQQDPSDLARVGDASADNLSSELESGQSKTGKKKASRARAADKKWSTSAQEQLNQFKGVPVVGGLPWRSQYLIAAIVLAVSVVALIGMAATGKSEGSSPAFPAVRVAAQHIVMQAGRSANGQTVNPEVVQQALDQGTKASAALGEQSAWKALGDDAQALLQRNTQLGPVYAAANAAHSAIEQELLKNPGVWAQVAQEGTNGTPEATALAHAWGAYRSINAQLESIALGGPVSDRLAEDIQTVNSGFASFRASSMMSQDTYLTRAWRELASSWSGIGPQLDKVIAAQASINQRSVSISAVTEHALALEKTLAAKERANGASRSGSGLLFFPALLALGSLGLLLWIARKQQRWQVLSSQAVVEQSDGALVELLEDLQALGRGDLTARVRVSPMPVGTVADSINQALEQLRRLVQGVKRSVDDTKSNIWKSSESTGLLIESHRQRASSLDSNSQKILQLIELVGVVVLMARQARSLSEQAQNAATVGHGAISHSLERMNGIRERVEEATGRTQRLVKSSNEIASIAESMNNLSEQLSILGVQASLNAAKAGDAGRGFKIVAQEIHNLAEETGVRARHVTTLVETELSDLEALAASMNNANDGVDEGVRFTDSANEAWRQVGVQLADLMDVLSSLKEQTQAQEDIATTLDEQIRSDLRGLARSGQESQEAAETMQALVSSVQSVDTALSQIKA